MTCLRKGHLLRFESNSTATSKGSAKSLEQCLEWFWISHNQSLQPMLSQMKCNLSKKQGFSYLNLRAQLLQRAMCKCLETISGMILNQLQPKFVSKSVADEMWYLKVTLPLRGHQRFQDKPQFFIWGFFEQFVFVNNHLLCFWPTIHNLTSKICPKFVNNHLLCF